MFAKKEGAGGWEFKKEKLHQNTTSHLPPNFQKSDNIFYGQCSREAGTFIQYWFE